MLNQNIPFVEIYTDGACSGNPGPGGWGALLICNSSKRKISGYKTLTTNNQMEMQAAISSLQLLQKRCRIKIYTDSKYLQNGITTWIHKWQKNNWKKSDNTPVKNVHLWQKLQQEIHKHTVTWHWIKGHSNNEGNDIADDLAVKAKLIAQEKHATSEL